MTDDTEQFKMLQTTLAAKLARFDEFMRQNSTSQISAVQHTPRAKALDFCAQNEGVKISITAGMLEMYKDNDFMQDNAAAAHEVIAQVDAYFATLDEVTRAHPDLDIYIPPVATHLKSTGLDNQPPKKEPLPLSITEPPGVEISDAQPGTGRQAKNDSDIHKK